MSIQPKSVQTVARSIGIPELEDEVAEEMALNVTCRVKDIISDAVQMMQNCKREKLLCDDIRAALRVRNVEALYGYHSSDPLTFQKSKGTNNLFFVKDQVVDFETLLSLPLPKVPVEPYFSVHWLAVDGVQPQIPQNPSEAAVRAAQERELRGAHSTASLPSVDDKKAAGGVELEVKPVVKHVLSREQQLYFNHITAAIKGSDSILKTAALKSIASDEGLHQLVPYFTQFIAEHVIHNLRDLELLQSLMHMARCLLTSAHINIEPYLHQLMPCVLTCLVGKRLCANPTQNHWALRDYTAELVALVCQRFGYSYRSLQPRITKTLTRAFLDPTRPLTTHYGAIMGLYK
jgi:transcription initiation factor TFIID subunit 6